jgi:hypothetical protein
VVYTTTERIGSSIGSEAQAWREPEREANMSNEILIPDDSGEVTFKINIVPDADIACPSCGAYWGNPDKALDFPNRFKVDDFCKCYNPSCKISYYNPYTGESEANDEM